MFMLTEWALGLLYLLGAASILCGATLAGCLLSPTWRGRTAWDFILNMAVRMAIGLGIFSSLVVILGFDKRISAGNVLSRWGFVSICGLAWMSYRKQWRRIGRNFRIAYRVHSRRIGKSSILMRLTIGAIALVLTIITLNILIGGLAPDFGHDSMWYHLSVPSQWVISGDCLAMPYVFPSNYPLALESVTAGILTFSNEILASAVNAVITLMLLMTILAAGGKYCPRHALLPMAALFVPVMAKAFAIAPIGVKNDRFAAWVLLLAFLKAYEIFILRKRTVMISRTILTGYLTALAVAAKVLTIAYIGPFMLLFAVHYLFSRKRMLRKFCVIVMCLGTGAILAYGPWLVRSIQYSGDPLFPYAYEIVKSVPSPFQVSYMGIGIENTMYDIDGINDITLVLSDTLMKLDIALLNNDASLFLLLIAAVGILIIGRGVWRLQGIVLVWFLWVLILIRGHSNVIRYFSICHPMSVLALGYILHRLFVRLSPRARILCLLMLLTASTFHYSKTQMQVASFKTIQWPFHPMVTRRSFERMAAHAEKGSPLVYEKVRNYIPENALVLVADDNYPYYLKRRTIWADEVVHKLSPSPLPWKYSKDEIFADAKFKFFLLKPTFREYLSQEDIGYILFSNAPGSVMNDLIEEEVLQKVPIVFTGQDPDWSLWKVNSK